MSSDTASPPTPPAPRRRRWPRGRWWLLGLGLLVLLAGFIPFGPLHGTLRVQVAQLLARQTGREVRVGRLTGSLWGGLLAEDVAVAGVGGFGAAQRNTILSVERLRLRYGLGTLLRTRDPLASIRSVTIEQPRAIVTLRTDHTLDLLELFRFRRFEPREAPTFVGRVRLIGGEVVFLDELHPVDGATRRTDLRALNADLRFRRRGDATVTAAARAPGVFEALSVDGRVLLDGGWSFDGTTELTEADLARLAPYLNPVLEPSLSLRSGLASAAGQLRLSRPRDEQLPFDSGFDLNVDCFDCSLGTAALTAPLNGVTGRIGVRMASTATGEPDPGDMITLRGLQATVAGATLRVDGRIPNPKSPQLDLRLRAESLSPRQVAAILADPGILAGFAGEGNMRADLRLRGQAGSWSTEGWFEPRGVGWGSLVELQGGRVLFAARQSGPGLDGWAGSATLTNVDAVSDRLSEPLRAWYGRAVLDAGRLRLEKVAGRIGAAQVALDGTLDDLAPRRQPTADLTATVRNLSPLALRALLPARFQPRSAQGNLSGQVRIIGALSAPRLVGRLTLPALTVADGQLFGGSTSFDLRLGPRATGWANLEGLGLQASVYPLPLTGLQGRIELDRRDIVVRRLRGRLAGDAFSVDGRVRNDLSSLDLRLAAPNLDVGRALRVARVRGWSGSGRGAADLRISGSRQRLRIAGTARVPRVVGPDITIDGAQARLDLNLVPSRGLAGLQGRVRLNETRLSLAQLDAPVYIRSADLRPAGSRLRVEELRGELGGDPFEVRGELVGLPRVRSMDLRLTSSSLSQGTLRTVSADLPLRLDEPAAVDLRLHGAWPTPRIEGWLVSHGATLTGDQEVTFRGRAELDLQLEPTRPTAPPLPVTGVLGLRDATVSLPGGETTLRDVQGWARLARDGSIRLVEARDSLLPGRLTAQLGDSEIGLSGSVIVRRDAEPVLDLLLDAPQLRLADVQGALAGLDDPPELSGEGTMALRGLRVQGPLDRLRVTSGPDEADWLDLPAYLAVSGYEVRGGQARVDLLLAREDGRWQPEGRLDLRDASVAGGGLGRFDRLTGTLRLADGRLERANLDASVGSGRLRVDARGQGDALASQIQARDVDLAVLMPSLADLAGEIEQGRLDSDLTIEGTLDNLEVRGWSTVRSGWGAAQTHAALSLRVLEDAELPGRQIYGAARLAGGDLQLASVAEPLRDLRGEVRFTTDRLVFDELSLLVAETPWRLNGQLTDLPRGLFDLTLSADGVDFGRLASSVRVAVDEAEGGGRRALFDQLGWPRLQTASTGRVQVALSGPRDQVVADIELDVPRVGLPAGWAIEDVIAEEGGLATLASGLKLRGRATGSLGERQLPNGGEAANAIASLAGLDPVADEADDRVAAGSLLDGFTLDLEGQLAGLQPRQVLALLPAETRAELLDGLVGDAYAYEPATVNLHVLGPATAPELQADLASERWMVRQLPVRAVRAAVRLTGDQAERLLVVDSAVAQIRGGALRAEGTTVFREGAKPRGLFRAEAEGLELSALGALGLTTAEPEGVASGDFVVELVEGEIAASGVADVARVRLAGRRVGDVQTKLALANDELRIEQMTLRDEETNAFARLNGSVGLDEAGALALAADVRGFDLETLAPLFASQSQAARALSGRLDFAGAITGTRQIPLLDGVANVAFGSLGGVPFMRLGVRAEPVGPGEMILRADLRDAAYQGELVGHLRDIDLEAGTLSYEITGDVTGRDLGAVAPLVGNGSSVLADSSGQLLGEVALTGRVARRVGDDGVERLNPLVDLTGTANLHLTESERSPLRVAGLPLDVAEINLVAGANQVRFDELTIGLGETQLALDPSAPNVISDLDTEPRIDLRLTSDEVRYEDLVPLTRVPLTTEGFVRAEAEVTGPLREVQADVRLATSGLVVEGEAIPDQTLTLRAGGGQFVLLEPATLDLAGLKVEASGGWTRGQPTGDLHVVLEDPSRLREVLDLVAGGSSDYRPRPWQTQLRGALQSVPPLASGRIELQASLSEGVQGPVGTVRLLTSDLAATSDNGVRPLPPIVADVAVGSDAALPVASVLGGPDGALRIVGTVDLGTGWPEATRLRVSTRDLDLQDYAGWVPALERFAGTIDATAEITMPAGRVEVSDGQLLASGLTVGDFRAASARAQQISWRGSVLSFRPLELEERSLLASISGSVPLELVQGRVRLRDDPSRPVDVRGGIDIFDLSEFEGTFGSLGWLEGNAKLELMATGRAREARVMGAATVQLPWLQVVHRPKAPRVVTATPVVVTEDDVAAAAAPEEPVKVVDRQGEVALLADTQVRMTVDHNELRIEQFEGLVVPPDYPVDRALDTSNYERDLAAGRLGSFSISELDPAGGGEAPPAVTLRYLDRARWLHNPVNLEVLLGNITANHSLVQLQRYNLALRVQPAVVGGRGLVNEVQVNSAGWLNHGYAQAAGTILARVGDPARWAEQEYHLRVTTPPLDPGAAADSPTGRVLAQVPDGARSQPTGDGQIIYPLQVSEPAVGQAGLALDLGLDSHTREYGPLTLWGKVVATHMAVREGSLGLLVADPNKPRAAWPAAPVLRVALSAPDLQRNRVVMRVPAVDVPFVANLNLSETPQRLRVDGSLDVASGSLYASVLRSPIEVQSGTATLRVQRNPQTGAFEPRAEFDSRSETTIRAPRTTGNGDTTDYRVQLRVRGTVRPGVEKPETEFRVDARSTPPLPEEVIFSRLTTSGDFATALEEGTIESFVRDELANAALQTALSYALTPIFDEIRRSIGLDEFAIIYELNRPFEMRAGKYLLKNLYGSLRVSINERGDLRQVVRLSYQVSRWFAVGAQYDSEDDTRVTVEYQLGN